MQLYTVKFKDENGKTRYTRSGSVQSTGLEVEGVMTLERAEKYVTYYDNATVQPYTGKIDGEKALIKGHDLYNSNAVVIKRTKKYIWIAELNEKGVLAPSTLQKYRMEHAGTYDFWTKSGFKLGEWM